MKSIKSLYLYVSTMLFVVAILFSAATADAQCYTCTNAKCEEIPANSCGMTACDEEPSCDVFGAICGTDCTDPGEG